MSKQKEQCYDDRLFHRFLDEQVDSHEEARVLDHIESCESCRLALEKISGTRTGWHSIKEHLVDHQVDAADELTVENLSSERNRDVKKIQQLLGPSEDPAMLGRLGGYEVCGVIGRGSAGVVVKALDTRLNRYVAIKLLAPVYSNNGSSRKRFEREGRAIASVKDPNVIPVHTVGDFQGTPYIVMQYVPDGSLFQRIEKTGPLSASEVVCVGMQVAKGLAAAHKRGIVHRDVKPANVLLERGVDCAMVTDFGLARVVDEATMTRSGAISGTPQYMSPEQAKGEAVDPRSDLFSLGSVMYTACTGHSPFRSETIFGVIKRVCESNPRPIREMNPEIPEWLAAFIEKLHAKNINERFESADQAAEILSAELAHMQAPTMVAKPTRDWWQKPLPKVEKKVQPKKAKPLSSVGTHKLYGGIIAALVIALGVFAWNDFGLFGAGGDDSDKSNGSTFDNSFNGDAFVISSGLPSLLEQTIQQNEEMERFKNSIETTIDVADGGQLFLRTNLGAVTVNTHDKPTVEMKLLHTVAAKDQETASKMFKVVKMNYDVDAEEVGDTQLAAQRDAVIIATFPTRKLTEEEIAEADDLEALKEQLLIRNNSHFRNANFEILVPKNFNLNLQTSAGPIKTSDLDGWAKLFTRGGTIEMGNISGKVNATSEGGHIASGNLGADSKMNTRGGDIEVGDVRGEFFARTGGGAIFANEITGSADVETDGGQIVIGHVQGTTRAFTMGGQVNIWKAEQAVKASSGGGMISVNFIGQPEAESSLESEAGMVRIGYIDGLDFDINAKCNLGSILAPFQEKRSNKMKYVMNDGEHLLNVVANTGSIRFSPIEVADIEANYEEEREERAGRRAFQRAYDLHMEGKIDEALQAHLAAAEYENYQGIATYNAGCAWALKGEKDKAFEALNDAITFGFVDFQQFETDEDLDSLRKDDRFEKMMVRLELCDDCDSDDDECCCEKK